MKVEWFADCKNPDEKEERREIIKSGGPTLEVMRIIIRRRLDKLDEDRRKRLLYDSPNWALMQADMTGAERELQELMSLLTIEGKE